MSGHFGGVSSGHYTELGGFVRSEELHTDELMQYSDREYNYAIDSAVHVT